MAEYDVDKAPQTPPHHHLHNPSEPLPKPAPGSYPSDQEADNNQFNGPTIAETGDSTTLSDKIAGKAQEVAGKVARKPELEEKGALRQERGKEFTIQE